MAKRRRSSPPAEDEDWNCSRTRGMPWRKPYDPTLSPERRAQRAYEVWISEIMLQQTQVATVVPYYNRWMAKFPTIRDLAGATIDEVNGLWKGLGYYNMEAKIPGIGRYSAGAICSIAYGEQAPVLDGNVHRLLSRFLALHAPPKAKATLDILWAGAKAMVEIHKSSSPPNSDAGLALIELGSTVCKVREPDCEACPLRTWCSAFRESTMSGERKSAPILDIEDVCTVCEPLTSYEGVTSYPMKVERKKAREELDLVHIVEWQPPTKSEDRRFLMIRRPETGLLAGLYDFPSSVDVPKTITSEAQNELAAETLSKIIRSGVGNGSPENGTLAISSIISGGDVVHIFSHIRKTYRVQWIILQGGDSPPTILEEKSPPPKGRRTNKSRTKKRSIDDVKARSQSGIQNGAIWVTLDEVMETNMGSGVVKVWNMVKSLWEGKAT
ncbi:DNA glycosylase [Pholiota molesta]|nr:DNA glycosylase [Pholiota molesta]